MRTRSTPTVEVVCDECGDEFELSDRNAREHRRNGTRPRCRHCRFTPKIDAALVGQM